MPNRPHPVIWTPHGERLYGPAIGISIALESNGSYGIHIGDFTCESHDGSRITVVNEPWAIRSSLEEAKALAEEIIHKRREWSDILSSPASE